MKFIIYIVLFLSLTGTFCSLRKRKQVVLEAPDFTTFPDEILEEINQYLALYQKPQITMNDQLKETAKLAGEEIQKHNTFGQHSNIEEWQNKVPNDLFTEMSFIVNVTNSNYYSKSLSSKTSKIMYDTKMSVGTVMKTPVAPTAQMFAKNIIEALESEHLLLTLDQYNQCGINIIELDQTKFPNEYLTIIHLIKSKGEAVAALPEPPIIDQELFPLLRYYTAKEHDHYITLKYDNLKEGDGNYAIEEGNQGFMYQQPAEGLMEINQYYSYPVRDHWYKPETTAPSGYNKEVPLGYCFPKQYAGTIPLYAYFNKDVTDHMLTKSKEEGDNASGYEFEQIVCYVKESK